MDYKAGLQELNAIGLPFNVLCPAADEILDGDKSQNMPLDTPEYGHFLQEFRSMVNCHTLPVFQVVLDEPSKCFVGGEAVTGWITFRPRTYPTPGLVGEPLHLTATLWGHTKTKLNRHYGKAVYCSKSELFREKSIIHSGRVFDLMHNTWKFSIRFPVTSFYAATGTDAARGCSEHHPLPPSFSIGDSRFGTRSVALVEYKLSVTLKDRSRLHSNHCIEQVLSFGTTLEALGYSLRTPIPGPMTHTRKFLLKSRFLDFEYRSHKLSLLERTRFKIKPSKIQEHNFHIDLLLPRHITMGSMFSCNISCKHSNDRADPNDLPSIIIRSGSMSLQATTYLTADRMLGRKKTVKSSNVLTSFSWENPGILEKDHGWEIKILGPRYSIPLPSFNTFNIRRCYSLKCEFVLKSLDKEFEVTGLNDIVVMP